MTIQTAPLPRPFKLPRAKYILFAAIAVMYAYVLWTNEMFLVDAKDPEWQHIAPFKLWLLPHGLAAAFALFLGPFQFSDRLRRKYIKVHKVVGYFYIAGAYHRRAHGHLYPVVRGADGRTAQLHHRHHLGCRDPLAVRHQRWRWPSSGSARSSSIAAG